MDEDETHLAEDTFYLDVYTREPFDALERYGWATRLANHAGARAVKADAKSGGTELRPHPDADLSSLVVSAAAHMDVPWTLEYE